MPDSRFSVILLDADETIFDFLSSEKSALLKTADTFNLKVDNSDAKVYSSINLSYWKQLERGIVTREELKILRFKKWFEFLGIFHIDAVEFGAVYEDNLSMAGVLFPKAEDFVRKLSEIAPVYIVTNGTSKCQYGRMNTSPVKKYISGMFVSEEIGFAKPDKRFFDKVFNVLNIENKSNVVIIGDSLSSDMEGGRNSGITTCLFCPSANIESDDLCDYIITDYDQFFEIVK